MAARGMSAGRHDALPTRSVVWGAGCRANLPDEIDRLGAGRVLLMTTASLAKTAHVADVQRLLDHRLIGTIGHLPAHVPAGAVARAEKEAAQSGADILVAFGGGSVIDGAKALAVRLRSRGAALPAIVALPTTLSGAEFAHVYGVLEATDRGPFKRTYADPAVAPRVILLDPELTEATPGTLWLSSGIKALDHAIEGLLMPGERPVTDVIALAGINRMTAALPAARSPGAGARLDAQLAAWMCYFAPATIRVGLSHRIGYVLGGSFQVPHSLTSCVTLAPVMRAFAAIEPEKLARIAGALFCRDADPRAPADAVGALVCHLGLPHRLRDLGIGADAVPGIADLVRHYFPEDCARLDAVRRDAFDDLVSSLW